MKYGRKKLRDTCTAIKKNGLRCQCKKLYRGKKCRFHGGLSLTNEDRDRITRETGRVFKKPGPKTEAGWNALREGYSAYVAFRRASKDKDGAPS